MSVHGAGDANSGLGLESGSGGMLAGVVHDGFGNRVLRACLDGGGIGDHGGFVEALGSNDLGHAHHTGGYSAGLIQNNGVDLLGGLQDFRTLNQQAQLRAAAGANQNCGWGGKTHRARAGDDQHGDSRDKGRGDTLGQHQVCNQRCKRNDDDGRDKNLRDTVDQALHGSF